MLTETGFSAGPVGSALPDAGRAAALLRWRTGNDHDGIEEVALRQAAALAALVMNGGRPAFTGTFREFAGFVAGMPF